MRTDSERKSKIEKYLEEKGIAGVSEISANLLIPPPTVFSILQKLQIEGKVIAIPVGNYKVYAWKGIFTKKFLKKWKERR